MNKCVPPDWFLGYDQFALYTFLNLVGNKESPKGYFKTYFRKQKKSSWLVNPINSLDALMVDYGTDFSDLVWNNPENNYFFTKLVITRLKLLFYSLIDITSLFLVSIATTKYFKKLFIETVDFDGWKINLNTLKLLSIFMILMVEISLPRLTLSSYSQFPFTCSLIAYSGFSATVISELYLLDSSYHPKYMFYSFLSCLLNTLYLKSYPFACVTLTNLVMFWFSLYQLTHNLFKFSFQFQQTAAQLERGFLSTILSTHIQNTL